MDIVSSIVLEQLLMLEIDIVRYILPVVGCPLLFLYLELVSQVEQQCANVEPYKAQPQHLQSIASLRVLVQYDFPIGGENEFIPVKVKTAVGQFMP